MEGRQYVVAVGSDDAGVNLKNFIRDQLSDDPRVEDVLDFGVADADDKTAYPVICIRAAEAVARGEADRAVLFGGTGLGLSLSHDIIAQGHGGTLHVASEEGRGTTFTIDLPLAGAAAVAPRRRQLV